MRNKQTISMRIAKFYQKSIYPKISNIRGSYRLMKLLERQARTRMDKIYESQSESVFETEWDNLLILDACRHDLFEELEGETPYRYSLGSHSADFIQKNFSEGDYSDTVVVTANPHYSHEPSQDVTIFQDLTGRKPDNVFHAVWHTYLEKFGENGTVRAERVLEDYRTARKLFPEKKIIVHLMQPHNPFIESDLEDLEEVTGFGKFQEDNEVFTEWDMAEEGLLSNEEVWNGYKQTLKYVLDVIKDNRELFTGKTMITSDHGNFAGEENLYDHPKGRSEEVLRKVPWVQLSEI